MRKKYTSFLIILLIGVGVGFADSGGQSLQQQFEIMKKTNYLNQVGVYFFNELTKATPKEYSLSINQGENKEVSLLLKNESDIDLKFRVKFADQMRDSRGEKGCSADYNQGFAKFITAPRTDDIVIPAKSETTKKIKIGFPIGMKGIQKGCIAYGITQDQKKNPESMISIVTRKVLYFDALIGSTGEINYKIDMSDIVKSVDTSGNLSLILNIQNIGNTDSAIMIQGELSNILGFKRPILTSGIILPNETRTFTMDIGKLPFYKGIFAINLTIQDKPNFEFDASKFGINDKIIAGSEKNIKSWYITTNVWTRIMLLLLITILYGIFRKRKVKIEEVQKPTP